MEKRSSTPKSAKKVVSTPKSVKKSVSTPKSTAKKEAKKCVVEKEESKHVVNFSSDDESDVIQDVERLVNFRPILEDIPEEDAEAHAVSCLQGWEN